MNSAPRTRGAIALALFLLTVSCGTAPVPVRPNVVLILSDDQGWGDLSLNGNSNLHTPNIDSLAEGGVLFDRFFVSPVCSPTRAELLTGRYHPRGGVYSTSSGGERLDLDETTIAQVFLEAGYRTAAFGKWHNGMQYPYHPNARGFEEYYGFCSGHWGNYFSPMLEQNGELVQGEGYIIDDLTDRALDFIEENQTRPFFLYIPYNIPHSPMQVPDEWWNRFSEKKLLQRHREPEQEDLQHTRAALAMCENIDWNVGRIVSRIEDLGLRENTIFVYFSDNGPNGWRWNGSMKGRKGSTDEGGVRSPLIMQWPGRIREGGRIEQTAGVIDLLPTLTCLAGIDYVPKKLLDGVSLEPLIMGRVEEWKERLIFSHWNGRTSVRSERYRLDDRGRLFDMHDDPGQTRDISSREPNPAARLRKSVSEWEADVLSELLREDNRPFPAGHPDFSFTQLPARDGMAEGGITRSNRYPNCTFFTNWKSTEDRISWDVELLEGGEFEAIVYYSCPEEDTGSVFELSFGGNSLEGKVTEAHDPPLTGMENDRVERVESYVKEFKPLPFGTIRLEKGRGPMVLKAMDIPGSRVMDFRLLMLRRL